MKGYDVYLTPENLKVEEEAWTRVNQEGDGHRIFSEAVKVLRPRSVIEFGCGTGWVAKDIHCRYAGVDSNLDCLELAMEKAPRGEFEWCDFRDYKDKRTYDVSCCFAFLKHFPLNEWDNVFGRLLGFGKYSVFTMSIDEDKDNGTEYPHVYVSWEHLNKEVEKSSVILGKQKITEDSFGQEWLITTRRNDG